MSINDVFIIMPYGDENVFTKDGTRPYTKAHFDDVYDILKQAVHEYDPSIRAQRMASPGEPEMRT